MSRNGDQPIEEFADRVKTARVIMDEANRVLSQQFDKAENKKIVIQPYLSRMQAMGEMLGSALPALDAIIEKLEKRNYPTMLGMVKDLREMINKIITDCQTLCGGSLEEDFREVHLNLINETRIAVHHLDTEGIDFMLKNVKAKVCSTG